MVSAATFRTLSRCPVRSRSLSSRWKRVTGAAAAASIGTGLAVNLLLEHANRAGWMPFAPGVLPTAVAMAASFAVLLAASWLSREEDIDRDVVAVMDV